MAKVVAISKAARNLAGVESQCNLSRVDQEDFFSEWQQDLPALTDDEQAKIQVMRQRLLYHQATHELLEGTVTLLVASPLLEIAGFYDPPFRIQAETAVEITLEDGEEILRGRLDVLVLQQRLWVLVLKAKKTTLPVRSALPQVLAYMVAGLKADSPSFGLLTNGDEVLFLKLTAQPNRCYGLSRTLSLYTVASEAEQVIQILKAVGNTILATPQDQGLA